MIGLVLSFRFTSVACQICLPFPKESLADRILEAEHLVLAREDPDKPFTLASIQQLTGDEEAPSMDLFLDSSTRRLLARKPEQSVLCGWSPSRREWRRLTIYDETIAPVVARILGGRTEWSGNEEERLRFFADYLGHEDTRLSDLAHIEIAGARYSQLMQYADRIPREDLLAYLDNFRRLEWHALYILFLGKSGHPEDREKIREEMGEAAEFHLTTRTAAWATAFLEIEGANGI
ncbi:MAG: hypothetical protein AAGC68_15425, partial [Verrucomicrobiota bacterium]